MKRPRAARRSVAILLEPRAGALLALVALAACSDPHLPLGPDFGNATAANFAVQVVNPGPRPPGASETDGQRIDNALSRYRTGRTYLPHLPLEGGKIYDQPQALPPQ
jgi:hypothetical protein